MACYLIGQSTHTFWFMFFFFVFFSCPGLFVWFFLLIIVIMISYECSMVRNGAGIGRNAWTDRKSCVKGAILAIWATLDGRWREIPIAVPSIDRDFVSGDGYPFSFVFLDEISLFFSLVLVAYWCSLLIWIDLIRLRWFKWVWIDQN